jgi:RNA polymerase sigma-70 factor (ECF subfamily)
MQIAQITLDTPAPDRTEEDELISSCVRGDTRGFNVLVRRYQDRIFNALFRMCGSREDAEELAQEAFLRAFEKLDTFNGKSRFYTWLFRIAMNMVLTRRRKTRRVRFVSLGACCGEDQRLVGEEEMADIADRRDPSPERSAIDGETSRRVSRAIAQLDGQLRAVVVLRDIDDMKYREISEVLNIPVGTVKSRLHFARCLLRHRLADLVE